MRISVFGLGYVGAVSAACLAAEGNTVVGVDTNPAKADLLNQGRAPVVEAGLGELIEEGVRTGRLRATTDCERRSAIPIRLRRQHARPHLTTTCAGWPAGSGKPSGTGGRPSLW
jgi:UDP-N-acetyl-D-mannosaminuronate dehydrogenase